MRQHWMNSKPSMLRNCFGFGSDLRRMAGTSADESKAQPDIRRRN
jgi:hypothetical protein